MVKNKKMEFCRDVLRLWHLVQWYGLWMGYYVKTPFAEINMMAAFLGGGYGVDEDRYLNFLWREIDSLWESASERPEDRQWKKQVLMTAYSGIYMMCPLDDFTAEIADFLGKGSEAFVEWSDKLQSEINGIKNNDYDVFCKTAALSMSEEDNTLFDDIPVLERVITELFESETMREYLLDNMASLSKWQVIKIICCAAISLERKWELFSKLASVEVYNEAPDESYRAYAESVKVILESLRLKENEIFIVEKCWYDEEIHDEGHRTLGPASSYEKALQMISGVADDTDGAEEWFLLNKWEKDEKGSYIDKSYYVYANGKVMYCSWDEGIPSGLLESNFDDFSPFEELNLPTPFQLGDIIKIDCTPFAPLRNVLILENQWPEDCCSLQGLYVQKDGYFSSGAVKHNHVFQTSHWIYGSPLYRAEHVTDFTEEDEILLKVKEHIEGDLEKSFQLQKCIHEMRMKQEDLL